MSSVLPDKLTVLRRQRRPTQSALAGDELGIRFAAVQVGYWLGWASILAVVAGLALDVSVHHRLLLVGATLAAAAGNTAAMLVPWQAWLGTGRGRMLLDLWCAGMIAFVGLLVANGGSSFGLLLFLVLPFIAVVQNGWRRRLWLAASAGTCAAITALIPLSAGATAMRLALVATAVTAALFLVRAIRLEAVRAEVARTRALEASHRIKNDLQAAADLLLLGRPDGDDGTAFDVTAERLRSIAAVHRLLSEADDGVDGGQLIRSISAGSVVPVEVDADPLVVDSATAQKLGIVANELITNAVRHGAAPITVELRSGAEARLRVENAPGHRSEDLSETGGLGLQLVRRLVEHGLGGRFELRATSTGTSAEIAFPMRPM